jgi:hypothetical protein
LVVSLGTVRLLDIFQTVEYQDFPVLLQETHGNVRTVIVCIQHLVRA